jgi:hypothetical protein
MNKNIKNILVKIDFKLKLNKKLKNVPRKTK